MATDCKVCYRQDRHEIESALLAGQSITSVAVHFHLAPETLQRHVASCASYVMSLDEFDREVAAQLKAQGEQSAVQQMTQPGSIQRQLKLKEADILAATTQEYLVTLKNLGRKINKIINIMDTPDGSAVALRSLRKPICDMYVQMGGEIRQSVRTLAELDKLINGPEENPLTGLQALATAIHQSAALQQSAGE